MTLLDGTLTWVEQYSRGALDGAGHTLRSSRCWGLLEKRGGEEGIRTPDTVSGIPDFESGAFSHSATSPWELKRVRGYLKRDPKSTAVAISQPDKIVKSLRIFEMIVSK